MKKILTVCIMLAALVFLAYAGTTVEKAAKSSGPTATISATASSTVAKDAPAKVEAVKGLVGKSIDTKAAFFAEREAARVADEALSREHPNVNGQLDDCTTAFPETFESCATPALPACWTQVDVAPPTNWTTSSSGGRTGPKCARIGYQTSGLNDWLFSAGVALTGGTSYDLKFWINTSGMYYDEVLEVKYGTAQTVVAMTNLIMANTIYTNSAYEQVVVSFTPGADGTYYIGWHATSVDGYYIYLDDIELTPSPLDPWKCCYGDVCNPTCQDMLLGACTSLGGTWTENVSCATDPVCPLPVAGDVCCDPDLITYGVAKLAETTCDFSDDYNSACLGDYSSGPDKVYRLPEVLEKTCVTISMTNVTTYSYPGLALFDGCPDLEVCVDFRSGSSGPLSIGCTELLPGHTYYVMVDNWPTPVCITSYDLLVETCACPSGCETYTLCGTPGEVEPNDACPAPLEQTVIGCDMTVYGLHCPVADIDFWQVIVPANSRMVLSLYEGEDCDISPMVAIKSDVYYDDCTLAGTGTGYGWNLSNPGTEPWVVYLKVYGPGIATYKIVATCCPLVDYLANPIVIDVPSSSFEQTVNTCCATNPIANVGGYASGPDVFFYHCGGGTWTFTASGAGDNQLIVFDADFNVLGEADNGGAGTSETLTLTIGHLCWYVGVSQYYTGCGDITLTIEGDTWLPVELTSFDAVSSDRAVTLNWATASENDNDYYRVLRSGEIVGDVNASGTVTGGTYTYTDNGLTNGTSYDYSVVAVSMSGEVEEVFAISATPSFAAATISEYALHQNFPNPFNPETKITFDLVDAGFVTLSVYNLLGQEVSTLVNSSMDAGRHIVSFDANNLPSGLYLYRMEVNGFSAQKKMVLMK